MGKLSILLACLVLTGCLFADDHAADNLTANSTNVSIPTSASVGNETVKETANAAGGFALDKILNLSWGDGLAAWLNSTFNTAFFTGAFISALLPLVSIGLIFWKWNAIMSFIQTAGQVLLVLIALYVVLRGLGVL